MPPARDDRPWLERMLGPDPTAAGASRAVAMIAVAIAHMGRGTPGEVLAKEINDLVRRIQ